MEVNEFFLVKIQMQIETKAMKIFENSNYLKPYTSKIYLKTVLFCSVNSPKIYDIIMQKKILDEG